MNAIQPIMPRMQTPVQAVPVVKAQPTYIMPEDNLTEIAVRRHESRVQKSTADEIQELNKMQKTGVMSPDKAEALKVYALASMQIDLKQPPSVLTRKPAEQTSFNVTA